MQQISRADVAARRTRADAAFVIDNRVYDVTRFLAEHPGGAEALLDNAGRDATQSFRDAGHSTDAETLMAQFQVGEVPEHERSAPAPPRPARSAEPPPDMLVLPSSWLPPLALAALAVVLYFYLF